MNLAQLALRVPAHVVAVRTDAEVAHWLAAVGLFEGVRVEVVRRALWGGPLHVRTAEEGEFAVAVSLAATIDVEEIVS